MDYDVFYHYLDPIIEYVDLPIPEHHSFDIAYYRVLIPLYLEFEYMIMLQAYDWLDDMEDTISPWAAINHAKRKKLIKEKIEKINER